MLDRLIEGICSWDELERRIAALPTVQERGEAFEEFCHAFFLLNPIFQFKTIYRHKDIPPSFRDRLGYPGRKDIGIDGLAVTWDGKLTAYQAKFRSDRKDTPPLTELSTFFTMSDRADWRITITNTDNLPIAINDRVRSSRVLADRLVTIHEQYPDFYNRLKEYLRSQQAAPIVGKTPHQTQLEAINAALAHFRENDRGQLILPCGTGKTLTALWIAEKIGGNRFLIMVPSLSLMSQTLREWAANTSLRPFRYLCLCSDTTVDLGNDSPIEHIYEMDVPVTTEPKAVSDFLTKEPTMSSVLFATYQSAKTLCLAVKKSRISFDLAIFDEAHRTTGTRAGVWNLGLYNNNIIAKKRLFMTATPRIFAPHIIKRAKEDDMLICSMDDEKVYGKPFYEMNFGQAIARKHISDYKIVVICVTTREIHDLIHRNCRIVTEDSSVWDIEAFAKRVALVKGMKKYGLKKVFTFHGSVKGAKAFTNTMTPYGLPAVFKDIYPQEADDASYYHVNGKMSSGIRTDVMIEFKTSKIGIMSNSRCLTEGVDVPAVDTVAFLDPKKSIIDIVQATGRAMRRAEWKEKGYIFIPVVIEDNSDVEKILGCSDFALVWQVVQSMVDQDQRLESLVSSIRTMQGKGDEGTQAWTESIARLAEKFELLDFPQQYKKLPIINNIYARTVEITGRKWNFWYGQTLKYKENFGSPNAVSDYITEDGFKLGQWQASIRYLHKIGQIVPSYTRQLEDLGFIWRRHDSKFERGYIETVKYKEIHGNANTVQGYISTSGFQLSSWQNGLRAKYANNKLSQDRINKMEAIGFIWNKFDAFFEEGYNETLKYLDEHGTPNAPSDYISPSGYSLGKWQSHQRDHYKSRKINHSRMALLEALGFTWDLLRELFERGYIESMKYNALHGTPNVPYKYTTADGFKLGRWQQSIRASYKENILLPDRVKKLADLGFCWDVLGETFELGLLETLKYKKSHGTPNANTAYVTPEGYKLGLWQSNMKAIYKKGKMPPERVRRFDELGFMWTTKGLTEKKAFERGYIETVKYKEKYGTPNASHNYQTEDKYKLGGWQTNIRSKYKIKNLSTDCIERLNRIGFKWKAKEKKGPSSNVS